MDSDQQVFLYLKSFDDQIQEMPFPALAWSNVQRFKVFSALKDKIVGIPALVVMDKEGSILTVNGRGQIEKNAECLQRWADMAIQ